MEKCVGKCHIIIRVNVYKKDSEVLFPPEFSDDNILNTPELFLSLVSDKSVRVEGVATNGSC